MPGMWLAALFCWCLATGGLASSSVAARNCDPAQLYSGAPCQACKAADAVRTVTSCLVPRHATAGYIRWNNTTRSPLLQYNQTREDVFGLGNHLGQYFQARAIAELANVPFRMARPFSYQGMSMSEHVPSRWSGYGRLSQLAWHCRRCPSPTSRKYPFLCPGAWLALDVPAQVRRLVGLERTEPGRDVVIQFRCGDASHHPSYGMLPFSYYRNALASASRFIPIANSTVITVVPDPKSFSAYGAFCLPLLRALATALTDTFLARIVVKRPGALQSDLRTFLRAQVFISGVSSLGLFAGMAALGQAFLPAHPLMLGNRRPCLNSVHWVNTTTKLCPPDSGCAQTSNIASWFVSDRRLQQIINRTLRGSSGHLSEIPMEVSAD